MAFLLRNILGIVIGSVAMLSLSILYNNFVENPVVRSQERKLVAAEARDRAMALIAKRSEDNAEISSFDRAHMCVELGGKWVPNEDRCD